MTTTSTTPAKRHWWSDTLFKRLLLLMWAALVASHLCAFFVVRSFEHWPEAPGGLGLPPVMPALPPGALPGIGPGAMPHSGPGGPQGERATAPPLDAHGGEPPMPAGERPQQSGFDTMRPPIEPGGMGPARGLPAIALWIDYAVRWLVIGIAAWFGARWLALPMARLAAASAALAGSLGRRAPAPAPLDEQRGTLEVQRTAAVFNAMADQLRGEFEVQNLLLAAISHDLRTPLARLRLRLEELGPPGARCVADVHEMDRLIASVLEMMRNAHEQAPRQRVDLRALVQAAVDDLADRGEPVRLADADPLPAAIVIAQGAALERVLANLIGNALRYGGSADVALDVRDGRVQVRVDDHGPGIPAGQLESVFRPFYRVEGSRSRETAGSGLGLYIARDLAERNGATLTLANRPEGGLRATLELPLA
ncbi:MAG: HAMP domain-containing histidine kinase [Proteobacteria bacterium]|nr:HAMP domain-containing histidine kinase [Pseudomonadota bacterium]